GHIERFLHRQIRIPVRKKTSRSGTGRRLVRVERLQAASYIALASGTPAARAGAARVQRQAEFDRWRPKGGCLMRKAIVTAIAACAAVLLCSGAFAQVPPDPNNPNEAVPEAMNPPAYGEPISLDDAKKVAAAAVAETKKRNWQGMCIAVVGPSGDLVYFEKD